MGSWGQKSHRIARCHVNFLFGDHEPPQMRKGPAETHRAAFPIKSDIWKLGGVHKNTRVSYKTHPHVEFPKLVSEHIGWHTRGT